MEVSDQDAYAMCLRLNREEGVIAGPSAALGLLGALAAIEDQPGNVVVVIFADNIYKYASSFERHFPDFRVVTTGANEPSPKERLMDSLLDNARAGDGTTEIDRLATRLNQADAPMLVDVRTPEVYEKAHLPGAINIPLAQIDSQHDQLPEDLDREIVTVCNRGVMSLTGLLLLQSLGYRRVRSLNGGTMGWQEAGHPVVAPGETG